MLINKQHGREGEKVKYLHFVFNLFFNKFEKFITFESGWLYFDCRRKVYLRKRFANVEKYRKNIGTE